MTAFSVEQQLLLGKSECSAYFIFLSFLQTMPDDSFVYNLFPHTKEWILLRFSLNSVSFLLWIITRAISLSSV